LYLDIQWWINQKDEMEKIIDEEEGGDKDLT